MSTETTQQSSLSPGLPVRAGVATVASVLANVALVLAADAFAVAPDFRALSIPPVVLLSVLGVVGAAAVYALLRRRASEPARTFRRVAAVVLVLSLLPDLGLLVVDPAATPRGVVVLMAMHVVVAGVSVRLLPAGER